MTNQAKMQGFDLDRLALELGALPEAPLAMPVQSLAAPDAPATPPVAPMRPVIDEYHGIKVSDPYRYMEDLKNPEVSGWMKAQSLFTQSAIERLPGRRRVGGHPWILSASRQVTTQRSTAHIGCSEGPAQVA